MSQTAPWTNTLCSYSAIELAEHGRRQLVGEDRGRRVVAPERPVRHLLLGTPSARTSSGGLAEGERLGLREEVGHQQVVLAPSSSLSSATGSAKPMKSAGISLVPWWISW